MDTITARRAPSSVRERRDTLGLTRQQVAQLANCSLSHIARIETEDAPARSKVLTRILRVLEDFEADAETTSPREEVSLATPDVGSTNDIVPAGNRREVPTSTDAAGPRDDAIAPA